jgi:hypothetical protein
MKKNRDDGCCNSEKFDSFVDSISEEIRNENWQLFWEKYGKLISYSIVVVLVVVGVYGGWQRQSSTDREAVSHVYCMAQNAVISGNINEALPNIRELSVSGKEPYKSLAKLTYAAILRNKGDKSSMLRYKQIAEDKYVDVVIREFSYLMYVSTSLDFMSTKEIMNEIGGFIDNLSKNYVGGGWNMVALETLAYCHLKAGNENLAKETLIKLAKVSGIPQDMADRVKSLLGTIDLQS